MQILDRKPAAGLSQGNHGGSVASEVYGTVRISTLVADGMDCQMVHVECSSARGFSGLQMIGNPSETCRDGRERARAALEKCGIYLPPQKIIMSLTPADLKKEGNHFDLPMAISLALITSERQPKIDPTGFIFAAELGLDGDLKPIRGVIPFALSAMSGDKSGLVVARANLSDLGVFQQTNATEIRDFKCLGFRHLSDILEWIFTGKLPLDMPELKGIHDSMESERMRMVHPNFNDMILSEEQKCLALTLATGFHNALLYGSPGTGKSMFAARVRSIMPRLSAASLIETLKIQSLVYDKIPSDILMGIPPFRSPHHSASAAALLGTADRPGELSLAHGGVLFLDEFPEFRRDLVEALREPLETGLIHISRSKRRVNWRGRVALIAACNPCPCGWYNSRFRVCRCEPRRISDYLAKMSGPILDRMDIMFEMEPISGNQNGLFDASAFDGQGADFDKSKSALLADHVLRVREFAKSRLESLGVACNADLKSNQIAAATGLGAKSLREFAARLTEKLGSNRSVLRVFRVARTLADIEFQDNVLEKHLVQALRWQKPMNPSGTRDYTTL